MNSELEILKKIWENNGKTYLRLISQQTGFGADYVRYICNCLLKKNQIKRIKGKRDWYGISVQGKKELKLLGIIKPKAPPSRVGTEVSVAEKVIYYFPKKLKIKPAINKLQEINLRKPKIIVAEEKKLNLGGNITRAVSFLLKRSRGG